MSSLQFKSPLIRQLEVDENHIFIISTDIDEEFALSTEIYINIIHNSLLTCIEFCEWTNNVNNNFSITIFYSTNKIKISSTQANMIKNYIASTDKNKIVSFLIVNNFIECLRSYDDLSLYELLNKGVFKKIYTTDQEILFVLNSITEKSTQNAKLSTTEIAFTN